MPVYQTLGELTGKRFAYVNGSVYNQNVEAKVEDTAEQFYASLPDCVAAVEARKADAAVQISYCCQLVVNRKGGTVALLPEDVNAHVDKGEVLSVITGLAERGLTMIVVYHEMRFARDASARVFYMDRGELWEAGPPEQIFEHPRRRKTHDFVFRVRSWEWDVGSVTPDIPAMEASISTYCQRQFMGRHATNYCRLLVDELVVTQLLGVARERGIANPGVHVSLSSGEGGVDMALTVDYRGSLLEGGDPLDEMDDELSRKIVQGVSERIEKVEPGLMRFAIKG